MNKLENEFFEAYKGPDNFCREVYGNPTERGTLGITFYIREMEGLECEGTKMVEGWKQDYDRLRYLVKQRNILAHGNSVTGITEADVDYMKDFHERLLNSEDPISLLERSRRTIHERKSAKRQAQNHKSIEPQKSDNSVYEWNPEKDEKTNRYRKSKKWSTSEALAVSVSVAILLLCAVVLTVYYLGYIEF